MIVPSILHYDIPDISNGVGLDPTSPSGPLGRPHMSPQGLLVCGEGPAGMTGQQAVDPRSHRGQALATLEHTERSIWKLCNTQDMFLFGKG